MSKHKLIELKSSLKDDDDDIDWEEGGSSNGILSVPTTSKESIIFFPETVGEFSDFKIIVEHLIMSKIGDKITIYIANRGGSCSTSISIVNYMKKCKAEITIQVTAPCYSAGSLIALAGDKLEMLPNTFLMFHNYNSLEYGKGNELVTSVTETDRWIKEYYRDLQTPFLTLEEIERIFTDRDLYIHSNEKTTLDRINRHQKAHKRAWIYK